MKYRKKPVVIEAFQWTGDKDQLEDPEWIVEAVNQGSVRICKVNASLMFMYIDTLEGTHKANIGDFIIRGIRGEIYPCKEDIFLATYDIVAE